MMKFRLVYAVFLSLLFLGSDSGGCSNDDAEPKPPPPKDYVIVNIFAKAFTYDCPDGGQRQETDYQYLIRFEFFGNNVNSSVNDAISENGFAYSYFECHMYQDDYISIKATVQGTTSDWQERTLFYKTALANCNALKEYTWYPKMEVCVSY